VKVLANNGLFPDWLGKGLTAYVAMLNTGLPTVRNNAGAHGTAPIHAYLARYALHIGAYANCRADIRAEQCDAEEWMGLPRAPSDWTQWLAPSCVASAYRIACVD
jgi:hypothetical protein